LLERIASRFRAAAPAVEFWSLRLVDTRGVALTVRQDVLEPVRNTRSTGAMVTVVDAGGLGYAATSDLTGEGLRTAAAAARDWAHRTAGMGLFDPAHVPRPSGQGCYRTSVERPWESMSPGDQVALLHEASRRLKAGARIVDWQAGLHHRRRDTLLCTGAGAEIRQFFTHTHPHLLAVANDGSDTQRRSLGRDAVRQGGTEQLGPLGFPDEAERVAAEALALLDAPECPDGTLDLLLMPSQMILQIHESIGHPLELDRILGDERNYAGRSFVTPDMFGSYRYGSQLLTATYDPTRPEEAASYGWDDEGTPAERQVLIRNGILERPLGGASSQARAGLPGVASARACDWNRPPVDRMVNLNLEPGESSFESLVESIERGVLMDTNRSWSIDDSRNKFQFGCEYARLIEEGRLTRVVRDPNYRGVSADFWRSLAGVGDAGTWQVMGVDTCGKGEPNQAIHAGHAAPPCVFRGVRVFSGV